MNKNRENNKPTLNLDRLAAYLPAQGPIKDFIHHNTLHAFQHDKFNFHEAIRCASDIYGSKEYLPLEQYHQLYAHGHISDLALQQIIADQGENELQLREQLLYASSSEPSLRKSLKERGALIPLTEKLKVSLDETIHPVLVRLLANYLDQGVSSLGFAEEKGSFWLSLREQLSVIRPAGFNSKSAHLILTYSPENILEELLPRLVPQEEFHEAFVLEILLQLPGWAGLIRQIELKPDSLFFTRAISLREYSALYLALLAGILPANTEFLMPADFETPAILQHKAVPENRTEYLSRLWHEAWELTFYMSAMAVVSNPRNKQKTRSTRSQSPFIQAIFCIDDRECSIRRHMEELSEEIETFGMPGFFGIDAMYLGPFDTRPTKQCPAPINPRHLLRGIPRGRKKGKIKRQEMSFWHRNANHLYSGWLISHIFSLFALVRLLTTVFFPRKSYATASAMVNFEEESELHLLRQSDESVIPGLLDGYSVKEMAERTERALRQIGLTHSFAPLIIITGHGSSSTNNPYFAAYDCGACSGHSGAINARAFAQMANRADVRNLLRANGLNIPDNTVFTGALHDTTRDEIFFLDEDLLPAAAHETALAAKQFFTKALAANAQERSRRFAMLPAGLSSKRALSEAAHRSEMLFEPRPEYNHATNALAIVGRRLISENTFLDRRAFLNSYDPFADKDGSILSQILSALVPVCGGINLEYLFSRLDSEVFGAGSKLPHNVVSLLGVANGFEGDLRTGLPSQMTEIHDPLRLLLIVEQKQAVVEKVIKESKLLQEWIWGGWINLAIYDYTRNTFSIFRDREFRPIDVSRLTIEYAESSAELIAGKRDAIKPARIRRGEQI